METHHRFQNHCLLNTTSTVCVRLRSSVVLPFGPGEPSGCPISEVIYYLPSQCMQAEPTHMLVGLGIVPSLFLSEKFVYKRVNVA
jgi:hypothetical protein